MVGNFLLQREIRFYISAYSFHFHFLRKTIMFITSVVMEISCLQKKSNCGLSLLIPHWMLRLPCLDHCSPGREAIQTGDRLILKPGWAAGSVQKGPSWDAGAVGIAGARAVVGTGQKKAWGSISLGSTLGSTLGRELRTASPQLTTFLIDLSSLFFPSWHPCALSGRRLDSAPSLLRSWLLF